MKESAIEQRHRVIAQKQGWRCLKFTSPGNNGYPDRIYIKSPGVIVFLEWKALGEKPDPLQWERITELRELGFVAEYVDSVSIAQAALEGRVSKPETTDRSHPSERM